MTRDDPLDPRHLPQSYSPAVVYTVDNGRTFFANVSLLDSGWLRCKRWDQSVVKVPAHRVEQVEMAPTESTRTSDDSVTQATHGLADADALEEARRLAQPTVEADAGDQEAVADD